METGVVIHGPDVIDSGMAGTILVKLGELGNVTAVMAGTIGKTAVLDAGLEDIIDISKNLKPSQCIKEFLSTKDMVILLNHGKTTQNGMLFANIVMSKNGDLNSKPIVHIERPGMQDSVIVPWNTKSIGPAKMIGNMLMIETMEVPELLTPISIEDHGHRVIRNVCGVHPGEKIMINGTIVGLAESEDIRIISEDGFIREIRGARIKEHGLEKLHGYNNSTPIDLRTCWVKSGPLRSNGFSVRRKKDPSVSENQEIKTREKKEDGNIHKIKAVIIDHEAERTFELTEGAQLAITVGDDTTDLAGDILYRLRIPVIGITDGDIDGFPHMKHIYPGSTVFRLRHGSDDIVGKKIKEQLFRGKDFAFFDSINEIKNNIFTLSKKYVIFCTYY